MHSRVGVAMIRSSNTFFGAVLAVAFSQIAFAADLPTKAPLAPVVTPPNWTGLYIGGSVGGRWADTTWTTTAIGDPQGAPDPTTTP